MAKHTKVNKINPDQEILLYRFLKELFPEDDDFEEVWNDWMILRDDEYLETLRLKMEEDRVSIGSSRYHTHSLPPTPCPSRPGSKDNLNVERAPSKGETWKKKQLKKEDLMKDSSIGKSSSPSPRKNLYEEFVNCLDESVMLSSPEVKRQKTTSGKNKQQLEEQGL